MFVNDSRQVFLENGGSLHAFVWPELDIALAHDAVNGMPDFVGNEAVAEMLPRKEQASLAVAPREQALEYRLVIVVLRPKPLVHSPVGLGDIVANDDLDREIIDWDVMGCNKVLQIGGTLGVKRPRARFASKAEGWSL